MGTSSATRTAPIPARRPAGHMIQLDGLRAIAAVAVVAQHTVVNLDETPLADWSPRLGVRLFFALSGYLITGILLRAREDGEGSPRGLGHALRAFYARRALRIFPLYYAALLVAALAALPGIRRDLPWHLFYLSNFLVCKLQTFPESMGHLWSLAVEEQFYLIWPAFVLLAPRRWLAPAFASLFAISNVGYALCMRATHNGMVAMTFPTSNLDTLAGGAMLALFHHRGESARAGRLCRWALIAGISMGAAHLGLMGIGRGWTLGQGLAHASNALIFLWLVNGAAMGFGGAGRAILESSPLTYAGKISYGIYVYHPLIVDAIRSFEGATGRHLPGFGFGDWRLFASTMAASVLVAGLSWKFFEGPLNDLKRFFPYETPEASSGGVAVPAFGGIVRGAES